MTAFRQYFEDNPEIFAALVAAIAILGGLLGSIIGAKIQANGGRDQAAAAREAAKIAAEAQRVAALWTVRQVQVAEFIDMVRELKRISNRFWHENPIDAGLDALLKEAHHEMERKRADIRLTASSPVVKAATKVSEAAEDLASFAMGEGPGSFVREILREMSFSSNPSTCAQARRALDAALSSNIPRERNNGEVRQRARLAALDALCEIPGMTEELALRALPGLSNPESLAGRDARYERRLIRSTDDLVEAAREMLRSEDDVAPAAPEQRRRWWRAA